jgi:hypothetical protein
MERSGMVPQNRIFPPDLKPTCSKKLLEPIRSCFFCCFHHRAPSHALSAALVDAHPDRSAVAPPCAPPSLCHLLCPSRGGGALPSRSSNSVMAPSLHQRGGGCFAEKEATPPNHSAPTAAGPSSVRLGHDSSSLYAGLSLPPWPEFSNRGWMHGCISRHRISTPSLKSQNSSFSVLVIICFTF